jgi:hypothetical protein
MAFPGLAEKKVPYFFFVDAVSIARAIQLVHALLHWLGVGMFGSYRRSLGVLQSLTMA